MLYHQLFCHNKLSKIIYWIMSQTFQHQMDVKSCSVTSLTIIHGSLWTMHWCLATLPVHRCLISTTICWSATVWAEGAFLKTGAHNIPLEILQSIMVHISLYQRIINTADSWLSACQIWTLWINHRTSLNSLVIDYSFYND
jgi:hypothetical protein